MRGPLFVFALNPDKKFSSFAKRKTKIGYYQNFCSQKQGLISDESVMYRKSATLCNRDAQCHASCAKCQGLLLTALACHLI
jgi:hypothetical protein